MARHFAQGRPIVAAFLYFCPGVEKEGGLLLGQEATREHWTSLESETVLLCVWPIDVARNTIGQRQCLHPKFCGQFISAPRILPRYVQGQVSSLGRTRCRIDVEQEYNSSPITRCIIILCDVLCRTDLAVIGR
ncbi:hypothetical protein IF1G_07992 [Cordyceps javanica]|uniref:Uncharacterized protein n=1 Tax=Cordyceps javanica TaxID=43265 RepID=A0A545UVB7_9HYPO|nr:hypothetical protein IF1G_07992 [Cordyceps javanica]